MEKAELESVRRNRWDRTRVVLPSEAYGSIANTITPGATFQMLTQQQWRKGTEFGVSLICSGEADAALMSHSTLDAVLAKRPAVCLHTSFQILETAKSLPLAVISRWNRILAERLRSRIDEMALDGTLLAMAGRYPRTPARGAILLADTLRLRYRNRVIWGAFAGSVIIAILAIALLTRQFHIQSRLRKTMAVQLETERLLRTRTDELVLSNEELQAFAYSVSHDLQEPLRTIALYSQMLERRCPQALMEAKEPLGIIRRNALRMQEMLQQLLLLSKVSRSELRKVSVPLQELIDTVLQDLHVAVSSSLAEIVVGPMPIVRGWPDRLNVVFQNLIGNALKYCKSGMTPRIEIHAIDEGAEWRLCVVDNGIGFEQQYAEKIFGVFRRLHVQDEYGGTGVGLAIVRRVVERHGGRVWAEGVPNQGSTFCFTIPKETDDHLRRSGDQIIGG